MSTTMPPFTVQRIDHLVLRVQDLPRSVAFYEAALGCTVVRRRDDLGLVHLRAGASMIDLVAVDGVLGRHGGAPAGTQGRNLDHLCLRIDPFDEPSLSAHLTALGAPPHGPAAINFGAEGSGPSLYFSDPDGNVVEVKGRALPAGT
jgi:glyoxylase I family protein